MKLAAFLTLFILAFASFGCTGGRGAPINEGITPEGRAYRGAENPKLVIYEYSDFECPFCGKAQSTVEEVLRAYPNEVQLQFRHYPLDIHPQAYGAALAAVCAEGEGKFWQMHDKMFASQDALYEADLKKYAVEIDMDAGAFAECMASASTDAKVRGDVFEAGSVGIQATPTFQIGESQVRGAQPFSKFKQVIDSELARVG